MGTFDGLTIGTSGLHAARRGVEVAGQNIANVNTPGYSRQRVLLEPDNGPAQPAFFSTWDGAGLGVRQEEIQRLRDAFLDRRSREETARGSELDELASAYSAIERVLGEPSDTGLSAVLADFYAAWDDVANRPDDAAARVQAVEQGVTVAANIRQLGGAIADIGAGAEARIESIVAEVNSAAQQVATLHATIRTGEASGLNVNELLDQRDQLLAQISERIGGSARYEDDGTVTYFVGSTALIRGVRAETIGIEQTASGVEVEWGIDGRPVDLGGRLDGLSTTVNSIVPAQLASLQAVSDTLRTEVNALHTSGFDQSGNPGLDFFVVGVDGIEVNAAIRADASLVASAAASGTVDGSIAAQIAGLSGASTQYNSMVVGLGVESQATLRRSELQKAVVTQVTLEQEAVNGVNMDEELADLVRFQRAYEANARFISSVDSLLETLIMRTGTVGR